MPRKSAAELSVGPLIPGQRPPPPDNLDAPELEIWEQITSGLPTERVADVGFQILAPLLCRHLRFANDLGEEIDALLREPAALRDDAKRAAVRGLLKSHGEQTSCAGMLATRLRLTPQARYHAHGRHGHAVPTGPRPWEDWSLDPEKAS